MRPRRLVSVIVAFLLLATLTGGSVSASSWDKGQRHFYTTAGQLDKGQVGDVLAHHHMFVELGAVPPTHYTEATPEEVYDVIGPWLEDAKALGIGAFVEMTPLGVGRRPDIVKYAADRAGLPTMLVTGIYREPFMPDWVYGASVAQIADFMRKELTVGVEDTGVPAGIIKLSQNATGMTVTERKVLEAACVVAKQTGAAIASHITAGPTALSVMDALDAFGCPTSKYRFIWIHAGWTAGMTGASLEGGRTGADSGMSYLMAAAKRGAYISLDGIGSRFWGAPTNDYATNIGWIRQLVTAGFQNQIIIGADTGWYDPGYPGGIWDYMQDYRSVPGEFVPAMRAAGLSDGLIKKLMQDNPFDAYSR